MAKIETTGLVGTPPENGGDKSYETETKIQNEKTQTNTGQHNVSYLETEKCTPDKGLDYI